MANTLEKGAASQIQFLGGDAPSRSTGHIDEPNGQEKDKSSLKGPIYIPLYRPSCGVRGTPTRGESKIHKGRSSMWTTLFLAGNGSPVGKAPVVTMSPE
jgi:hypothetical protein